MRWLSKTTSNLLFCDCVLFVTEGYIFALQTAKSSSAVHLSISVIQGKIAWHCVKHNLAHCYITRQILGGISQYQRKWHCVPPKNLTYFMHPTASSGSRTVTVCRTPDPLTAESTFEKLVKVLIFLFQPVMVTKTVTWTLVSIRGRGILSRHRRQLTEGYESNLILQFIQRRRLSSPGYTLYFYENHIETER